MQRAHVQRGEPEAKREEDTGCSDVAAPRDEVQRQQSVGRIDLAEQIAIEEEKESGNFSQPPAQQLRGLRQPDALRGRPRWPVRLDALLLGEEARASLLVAALSDDIIKINLASCTSGSAAAGVETRHGVRWLSCSSARVLGYVPFVACSVE